MRVYNRNFTYLLATAGILSPVIAFGNSDEYPNIIVILCDDLGYSDVGCYGGEISTPNIDELAYDGMRMTQFYSNPRSCPARASLLTGMYSTSAGIGQIEGNYGITEYQGYLRDDCVTIGESKGRED